MGKPVTTDVLVGALVSGLHAKNPPGGVTAGGEEGAQGELLLTHCPSERTESMAEKPRSICN